MRNEVIGQYMTHSEMGMCMRDVSGCMGYVLKTWNVYDMCICMCIPVLVCV